MSVDVNELIKTYRARALENPYVRVSSDDLFALLDRIKELEDQLEDEQWGDL
jgi:hypothetical protein